MRTYQNDDLWRLLTDEEPGFRMLAQHFLSEGYAQSDEFLDKVFLGWDTWGVEKAFPEFPMLTFVPVPADRVDECCQRAQSMARGRPLTDPVTRCAGKLMEQVVRLPADELRSQADHIAATKSSSKIFFRVDVAGLNERLELLELNADGLAQRLDSSIESLALEPNNVAAYHTGLHALETLRRQHPHYMDLSGVLAHRPPESGARAASFNLTVQSLINFEQRGLERMLAPHTSDPRESIHSNSVEALVRLGTPAAAAVLIHQFPSADLTCRHWLARGLQRIRAEGLASDIAGLRSTATDPALWLMLLVAEVHQFDQLSIEQILLELDKVRSYSGALIDALSVYVRVHEHSHGARELQRAFLAYLQRVDQSIHDQLVQHEASFPGSDGQVRANLAQRVIFERFRRRKN